MKHLAIIICASLLSVMAVDLSPRKLLSLAVRYLIENDPRFDDAMIVCIERKLEVVGEEIDEDEMIKEIKRLQAEEKFSFVLGHQVKEAKEFALAICVLELNANITKIQEEILISIKEDPTHDQNLDCYKTELERLQSDSENFTEEPTCGLDLPHTQSAERKAREYRNLNITKCTFEEYFENGNPKTARIFQIKTILMLKDPNEDFQKILKISIDEKKKLYEDKLKCILDEIYDR